MMKLSVKLYPGIELMDIYYGYRYGWLTKLLKVSDTVMLRPETKLGKAFNKRISIKQYLNKEYGISMEVLNGLKIMLDHGIFINEKEFSKIFGVQKSPKTLIEIYDVLKVSYGLAYDVPSKLHIEIAVETALSELLNRPPNDKILKALYPSMRTHVENLANILINHIKVNNSLFRTSLSINNLKQKLKQEMYKLLHQSMEENTPIELRDALYALSERTVEETIKNLEEQLEFKAKSGRDSFRLVPVVQGLFEEYALECLDSIIDLLIDYQELFIEDNRKHIYIAIGTGGKVLSGTEAEIINKLMQAGFDRARRSGVNVRFHVLGWSNPKIAEKLRIELIYSSDSLSARRRAVEGKVYMFTNNGKIRLVHVANIDCNLWSCPCPVCSDPELRRLVLDPSGSRKNDARIVHNLWIIKQYISSLR